MPTYEYACRECGEHVEVVQSFRDGPLEECGLCGGRLRKVFSAAGIIFKGDGYYVTDTRKQAKAATKTKDASSSEASTSSTSSEPSGKSSESSGKSSESSGSSGSSGVAESA